jgi:uncharacterized protein YlxW (UPF0749 family)
VADQEHPEPEAAATAEPPASSHALGDPADPVSARPQVTRRTAWRRLSTISRARMSRGNVLAALLTLVLGLALVAQVRSTHTGDLESLRESDLVALLDDVTARADQLEEEVRSLEQDRSRLEGSGGDAAAAEAAQSRLESYQILAGTVPVSGPGVTVRITDPEGALSTTMMIDLVQELRDAGSEAIQIGPVRVVASTWIGVEDGVLTVDGQPVAAPYRVVAIGEAHTLAGALAIPGGFNDSVRRVGGTVEVNEGANLTIDAVHEPGTPEHARPVPPVEGR